MTRWLFAALHLFGLGMALGSVWARGRALRSAVSETDVRRVLAADTWWGISALVLIGTGLTRLFVGFDKPTAYYLNNHMFWTKMGLLVVILVLEITPMLALIRWRMQLARGAMPDTSRAAGFARISAVQALLVVLMILMATGMARGFGVPGVR
jgi:putative membrane protein